MLLLTSNSIYDIFATSVGKRPKTKFPERRKVMFSELIASSWFNPWSVGALLGMFVLYPLMTWRDGYHQTATYWLNPVDFSGPVECYVSLHRERIPPQSAWLCLLGHSIGLFHMFIFGGLVLGFILIWPFLAFGWKG